MLRDLSINVLVAPLTRSINNKLNNINEILTLRSSSNGKVRSINHSDQWRALRGSIKAFTVLNYHRRRRLCLVIRRYRNPFNSVCSNNSSSNNCHSNKLVYQLVLPLPQSFIKIARNGVERLAFAAFART